jgi:hypothetical protein
LPHPGKTSHPTKPPTTKAPASKPTPTPRPTSSPTPKPSKTPKPSPTDTPTPSPSPSPTPTPTPTPITGATLPSQVLNLTNWKITLPVSSSGGSGSSGCQAAEVDQPQLGSYTSQWFKVVGGGDGVVFRANIEGCTTSGSGYPRSELREETDNGMQDASWSTTSGTAAMTLTEAVTHLPVVKPQTTFAQIHNASDDVFEAEATGNGDGTATLNVNHNGGVWGVLDSSYVLGTRFTLKIVASGGYIDVYYNGVQKVHEASSASGCYFKAGDYTQSNIVKGHDSPGAYGEVVIYALNVQHT